jgi:hypothetical protein
MVLKNFLQAAAPRHYPPSANYQVLPLFLRHDESFR